ncbi:MAG: hypothetical protein ABEI96_07560 [Haloarculaceae archaeon]
MQRQTRGTAAVVALADALVALLPKVVAYGLFTFSPLRPPIAGIEWLVTGAVAVSFVIVAAYSYRRYRRDARALAVTRGILDRVRNLAALRPSSGAYFS